MTVNFLNDALSAARPATDRNLHVDGISFNGKAIAAGTADLKPIGPVDFASPRRRRSVERHASDHRPSAPVTTRLVLKISQDAF